MNELEMVRTMLLRAGISYETKPVRGVGPHGESKGDQQLVIVRGGAGGPHCVLFTFTLEGALLRVEPAIG